MARPGAGHLPQAAGAGHAIRYPANDRGSVRVEKHPNPALAYSQAPSRRRSVTIVPGDRRCGRRPSNASRRTVCPFPQGKGAYRLVLGFEIRFSIAFRSFRETSNALCPSGRTRWRFGLGPVAPRPFGRSVLGVAAESQGCPHCAMRHVLERHSSRVREVSGLFAAKPPLGSRGERRRTWHGRRRP